MIGTAIIKETQLLLRDRGALASLFALPLIFILVFGSMFGGGGADKARVIAVHHHAENPIAARVVAAIERSGMFRIEAKDSVQAVERYVATKRGRVGLILPRKLDPKAGVPAELIIDQAASIRFRGPIIGAISGMVQAALDPGAVASQPPRVLATRSPPGIKKPLKDVDGFQVSVPGNAVLFGFFLALTVALSFVEERKSGTWRRLLAAPVHRPTLLVAKLVPYFFVGLIQMTFLLGVGALAFGMKVAGSVVALCVLTVAVVFCATALGLFIASFGGTEKQVGSAGSIIILVMGLLGGAMIPRLIMPETMQTVGLAVPHGWALEGYYDVLIREGTTLADVAGPIGAVFGFGVVFIVLGSLKFKFER